MQELNKLVANESPPSWLQTKYSPGPLSESEFKFFMEEGYLVKENIVDIDRVKGAQHAVEGLIDILANRLFDEGLISDKALESPFEERLIELKKQYAAAPTLLHKIGILPPGIQRVWDSPQLLQLAMQLLGGQDISGHPVWNLRVKTPDTEQATVPWHQDAAYLHPDSSHTLQVTAWVPLVPATAENGCMQVIPRSHLSGRTARHTLCAGDTWYVDLSERDCAAALGVGLAAPVTCEVPVGGALLINNLTVHRSTENRSNGTRWSLDLRWQLSDQPDGFWGLKPPLPMCSSRDPHMAIDWEGFTAQDRPDQAASREEMFSDIIAGPWMDRWDVTHPNRHTDAHKRQKQQQQQQQLSTAAKEKENSGRQ